MWQAPAHLDVCTHGCVEHEHEIVLTQADGLKRRRAEPGNRKAA